MPLTAEQLQDLESHLRSTEEPEVDPSVVHELLREVRRLRAELRSWRQEADNMAAGKAHMQRRGIL